MHSNCSISGMEFLERQMGFHVDNMACGRSTVRSSFGSAQGDNKGELKGGRPEHTDKEAYHGAKFNNI